MQKLTVDIQGMMCGMCEAHICDAIRSAFHVKKVTASHSKNEAVILTEADISESELKAVISKTGYQVLAVRSEPYEKKGLLSFFGK